MHDAWNVSRTPNTWKLLSMFDLFDADHDLMIVMLHVTHCGSLTKTADIRAADCSEQSNVQCHSDI